MHFDEDDPEWVYIEDYPDYLVSSNGEIMKERTNRLMTIRQNQQGINMVDLHRDGYKKTFTVDRIVAHAFLGPEPFDSEQRYSPVHINGDRADDRANNLMWQPRWWASEWHRMMNKEDPRIMSEIRDIDTGRVFHDSREAAQHFFLTESQIINRANQGDTLMWEYNYKKHNQTRI